MRRGNGAMYKRLSTVLRLTIIQANIRELARSGLQVTAEAMPEVVVSECQDVYGPEIDLHAHAKIMH